MKDTMTSRKTTNPVNPFVGEFCHDFFFMKDAFSGRDLLGSLLESERYYFSSIQDFCYIQKDGFCPEWRTYIAKWQFKVRKGITYFCNDIVLNSLCKACRSC